MLRSAALLLAAALAVAPACAAEIVLDGAEIQISGHIVAGDMATFAARMQAGNGVNLVRLNSPGGFISEAIKIAAAIHAAHLNTAVSRSMQCKSACFLMFAAGAHRYASDVASIGVHGASAQTTYEAGYATVVMTQIAKKYGVPDDIAMQIVMTDSTHMHVLTVAELQHMGVTIQKTIAEVPVQALPPMVISPLPPPRPRPAFAMASGFGNSGKDASRYFFFSTQGTQLTAPQKH